MPTYNLQFATVEQQYKRPVVPMKQVKYVNKIMGTERLVKAPDIEIDGVSSYRMQYFKQIAQRPNPFGKRVSEVVATKREANIYPERIL